MLRNRIAARGSCTQSRAEASPIALLPDTQMHRVGQHRSTGDLPRFDVAVVRGTSEVPDTEFTAEPQEPPEQIQWEVRVPRERWPRTPVN